MLIYVYQMHLELVLPSYLDGNPLKLYGLQVNLFLLIQIWMDY